MSQSLPLTFGKKNRNMGGRAIEVSIILIGGAAGIIVSLLVLGCLECRHYCQPEGRAKGNLHKSEALPSSSGCLKFDPAAFHILPYRGGALPFAGLYRCQQSRDLQEPLQARRAEYIAVCVRAVQGDERFGVIEGLCFLGCSWRFVAAG